MIKNSTVSDHLSNVVDNMDIRSIIPSVEQMILLTRYKKSEIFKQTKDNRHHPYSSVYSSSVRQLTTTSKVSKSPLESPINFEREKEDIVEESPQQSKANGLQ